MYLFSAVSPSKDFFYLCKCDIIYQLYSKEGSFEMIIIKILFVAVISTPIFALGCYLITKVTNELDRK